MSIETVVAAPKKVSKGSSATKLFGGRFDRSSMPDRADISVSLSVVFLVPHDLVLVRQMVLVRVASYYVPVI